MFHPGFHKIIQILALRPISGWGLVNNSIGKIEISFGYLLATLWQILHFQAPACHRIEIFTKLVKSWLWGRYLARIW